MHKTRVWIIMGCCLFAVALFAWAQGARKAGLWEVTTTMNFGGSQMPPGMPPNAQMPQLPPGVKLPPGVQMPQGMGNPFGPRTTQVCYTQAMMDKFGGVSPATPNKNSDCKMTNISITAKGMTATMVCTGQMNATGTVEATFVDANTTSIKIHIKGTTQRGQNSMPVDMSMQSTSVYKGPDCGSVKPFEMPAK
jgi:hypothetical protein